MVSCEWLHTAQLLADIEIVLDKEIYYLRICEGGFQLDISKYGDFSIENEDIYILTCLFDHDFDCICHVWSLIF